MTFEHVKLLRHYLSKCNYLTLIGDFKHRSLFTDIILIDIRMTNTDLLFITQTHHISKLLSQLQSKVRKYIIAPVHPVSIIPFINNHSAEWKLHRCCHCQKFVILRRRRANTITLMNEPAYIDSYQL